MVKVDEVKRGAVVSGKGLAARVAAALDALGEDLGVSPEEALAKASADAAERFVADLESRVRVKAEREAQAAEAAKLAEEKAAARAAKIIVVRSPISEKDGRDLVLIAAICRRDVNSLIVGWLQDYLDTAPRPELALRAADVQELSSGGGWRLSVGVTRAMQAALVAAAGDYPPPRENANYRPAMLQAAIIRAGLARELETADPEALRLVRAHHGAIRESANVNNYKGWRDGNWPVGVSVESVKRYQETCGRYAEELALHHQIFAGVPSPARVDEERRRAEAAERARAAKEAEMAAIAEEQAKLRALIA